ncbi:hypothetical protein H4R22_000062 [Coemansia sp. RSA 1290]|nr:hypothetical protein BX667DRAFT_506738 [Coemansia mojavensis]KAJ1744380.1 hypothetical protein LPJ68_000060 [Coemansia sp. RSA 1086]KAJ1753611.1 hypothetical protein LPJ79_000204 [Coemansia sp. RSA 1821]KAJ1876178.1 hypothetical protein LPJ55_000080 [Coemansia sp. RSA 990]KAJ2633974.1 hypothetical protein H4R22_000062 [Coemansia sp. RSA 1290]KAJ2652311.1 hypothetical protein IWW40_001166 [Coemansia sp. RSA 1250]KAJ2675838.1 hypothetical protein IWW42_000883 [Coemansia sp. RSA 1085]
MSFENQSPEIPDVTPAADGNELTLTQPNAEPAKLSPSATSMLQVLIPSLTRLDALLESVWNKQDTLNEVLNRLATELDQFDELVLPPGVSQETLLDGEKSATSSQQAAQRLKASRARVADINATLKKVRARLDDISMLAQAKILQGS